MRESKKNTRRGVEAVKRKEESRQVRLCVFDELGHTVLMVRLHYVVFWTCA